MWIDGKFVDNFTFHLLLWEFENVPVNIKSARLLQFECNRSTLIWLLYSAKIRLMLEIWKVSKVSSISISIRPLRIAEFTLSLLLVHIFQTARDIQNYISPLAETP